MLVSVIRSCLRSLTERRRIEVRMIISLWGARDGPVVRALASHQCGLGSNPGIEPYVGWVCCWFSPLLREVFLRVLRFSSRFSTLWMCYLQIIIYLLQLYFLKVWRACNVSFARAFSVALKHWGRGRTLETSVFSCLFNAHFDRLYKHPRSSIPCMEDEQYGNTVISVPGKLL